MKKPTTIETGILPNAVRSRILENINGLKMHFLESGYETSDRPAILLLHGFPELAYSWRKIMLPLAEAGYHVVAPDQRGYGRTTGWDPDYDGDLSSFRLLNLVRDAIALISALGYSSVKTVVGHDFGSSVAAYCALVRPDFFHSVTLMSAPFDGPPGFSNSNPADRRSSSKSDVTESLLNLKPARKHYRYYYCGRSAEPDMLKPEQGLGNFLRAYFHYKSADWPGNQPFPLKSWEATELAKMPTYYIMEAGLNMAESVAPFLQKDAESDSCAWLSNSELQFYANEFGRTGFQGGLQWYRCSYDPGQIAELRLFAGSRIQVPACFIAGQADWGTYQAPGVFEKMQKEICTQMVSCDLVANAGHWVQQEQPEAVVRVVLEFVSGLGQ